MKIVHIFNSFLFARDTAVIFRAAGLSSGLGVGLWTMSTYYLILSDQIADWRWCCAAEKVAFTMKLTATRGHESQTFTGISKLSNYGLTGRYEMCTGQTPSFVYGVHPVVYPYHYRLRVLTDKKPPKTSDQLRVYRAYGSSCDCDSRVQGGPAKVRPTYIFDGNIWMHR